MAENKNDFKNDIGPLKFTPLFMIVLFFGISYMYSGTNSENKIEFGNFGVDSEIGTFFSVFLAIAAIDILIIKMLVDLAKKDSKNILITYVSTEIPAIFGFALTFITSNVVFFYPFGILSIAYYLYVYNQLGQKNNP